MNAPLISRIKETHKALLLLPKNYLTNRYLHNFLLIKGKGLKGENYKPTIFGYSHAIPLLVLWDLSRVESL